MAGKKLSPGTFKTIIRDVELELNLKPGTINFQTIKSRVFASNPDGMAPQKVSPIAAIEPLLCNLLGKLARVGEAQTKTQVIELANVLIHKIIHADCFICFCEKRNIKKGWRKTIVRKRWYRNFMVRSSHKLKRAKYKVMDANRHTNCTYKNFNNMYSSVYEHMVEAGVAV
jgi:hypothetical protein